MNNPIPYKTALTLGIVSAEQASIIENYVPTVRKYRGPEGITVTAGEDDALTVIVARNREDEAPATLTMIGDLIVPKSLPFRALVTSAYDLIPTICLMRPLTAKDGRYDPDGHCHVGEEGVILRHTVDYKNLTRVGYSIERGGSVYRLTQNQETALLTAEADWKAYIDEAGKQFTGGVAPDPSKLEARAVANYKRYKGNAEAAWENEDEVAWADIVQFRSGRA